MSLYTLLQINRLDPAFMDEAFKKAFVFGDVREACEQDRYVATAMISAENLEDAFDVDCNPSRDDEKELKVTNLLYRRSMMKVGDILMDNNSLSFYSVQPRGFADISPCNWRLPKTTVEII